jgi:hypothetical protein
MTPRDLRVREISEFFKVPTSSYEDLNQLTLNEIYNSSDFSYFNELYPLRYNNYKKFLEENGLEHNLEKGSSSNFVFIRDDLQSVVRITQSQISSLTSRPYYIDIINNKSNKNKPLDSLLHSMKQILRTILRKP